MAVKTPDEIKKGLYSCTYAEGCAVCPYDGIEDCAAKKNVDALSLIQQLEAQNAELLGKIKQLEQERETLIRIAAGGKELCDFCVNSIDLGGMQAAHCNEADFLCDRCKAPCPCRDCQLGSAFAWNGKCL